MKNRLSIDYDEEADVLYVSFGEPKKAVTEEFENVCIRVDQKTNQIVGVTVIDFLHKFKEKHEPIQITF